MIIRRGGRKSLSTSSSCAIIWKRWTGTSSRPPPISRPTSSKRPPISTAKRTGSLPAVVCNGRHELARLLSDCLPCPLDAFERTAGPCPGDDRPCRRAARGHPRHVVLRHRRCNGGTLHWSRQSRQPAGFSDCVL